MTHYNKNILALFYSIPAIYNAFILLILVFVGNGISISSYDMLSSLYDSDKNLILSLNANIFIFLTMTTIASRGQVNTFNRAILLLIITLICFFTSLVYIGENMVLFYIPTITYNLYVLKLIHKNSLLSR